MLNEIESRITAIVGDGLRSRGHLSVVQAPAAIDDLDSDSSVLRVSLREVTPEAAFERAHTHFTNGPSPTSRRVLPIRFGVKLEFRARPEADSAEDRVGARLRMLEDLSLAAHWLGAPNIRSGAAFATNEPGQSFRVLGFEVRLASAPAELEGDLLSAELDCEGRGLIWPPESSRDEGTIGAVDTLIVVPVSVRIDRPLVPLGATTTLRVSSPGGQRLTAPDGSRAPAALAVTVLSELPPDRRGRILSGVDGAEVGVRIVGLEQPETAVTYRAPASNVGATRTEYVAVHLASAGGRLGPFLGSAALRLAVEEG